MDSSNICVLCENARMRDDVCGIYCVGEYWKNDDGACGHFKEHKEATMNNNALADASGWISVKDRLPEVGGYVVCIAKRNPFSRFMPMVARIEKNGWVNPITEQYISEVTHWMPIPEPPEEG